MFTYVIILGVVDVAGMSFAGGVGGADGNWIFIIAKVDGNVVLFGN